jgi:hypothetical protein
VTIDREIPDDQMICLAYNCDNGFNVPDRDRVKFADEVEHESRTRTG